MIEIIMIIIYLIGIIYLLTYGLSDIKKIENKKQTKNQLKLVEKTNILIDKMIEYTKIKNSVIEIHKWDVVKVNNISLYMAFTNSIVIDHISGFFYIYNTEIINGNIEITNHKDNEYVEKVIHGWVKLDEIDKFYISYQ